MKNASPCSNPPALQSSATTCRTQDGELPRASQYFVSKNKLVKFPSTRYLKECSSWSSIELLSNLFISIILLTSICISLSRQTQRNLSEPFAITVSFLNFTEHVQLIYIYLNSFDTLIRKIDWKNSYRYVLTNNNSSAIYWISCRSICEKRFQKVWQEWVMKFRSKCRSRFH